MKALFFVILLLLTTIKLYSQEIIVSKDSLNLLFDDLSHTSRDSLNVFNTGAANLNIDTIFSSNATGFVLNIVLKDTTIHSAVTWRNNFYTPFSMEPNDSAKLIFIFPLWIPKTIFTQEIWTDTIIFLNNSLNNNTLLIPAKIDFPVSINDLHINFPDDYLLFQNYPNPFNPTTTFRYQIPELNFVTIKVYDVLGNEIATLVNEEKPAGSYQFEFDENELTSGIYFYRLQAGNFVKTKKMILMK